MDPLIDRCKSRPDNDKPREEMTYTLRFDLQFSNNKSEYEALIAGLQLTIKMGCEHSHGSIDLMVIANQKNALYEIRGRKLAQYADKAKTLVKTFESFRLEHVSISKNKRVDVLSKLASSTFLHITKKILVEIGQVKEIDKKPIIEDTSNWRKPIMEYLTEG